MGMAGCGYNFKTRVFIMAERVAEQGYTTRNGDWKRDHVMRVETAKFVFYFILFLPLRRTHPL